MSTNTFARVGEAGFVHNFDTDFLEASISSATIHYTKPDGTVVSRTCDQVTSSTGQYGWLVTAGHFDTPGRWKASLEINIDGANNIRKSKTPVVLLIGASDEA